MAKWINLVSCSIQPFFIIFQYHFASIRYDIMFGKSVCFSCFTIQNWLVVWNMFYFCIYWVANHPNWLSYFSEGWPNHQPEKKSASTKGEVLVKMRREMLSRVTSRMKRRFKPREMLRRAVKQRRQSLVTDQWLVSTPHPTKSGAWRVAGRVAGKCWIWK